MGDEWFDHPEIAEFAGGREFNPLRLESKETAEAADQMLLTLLRTGRLLLQQRCAKEGVSYEDLPWSDNSTIIERFWEHKMGYPLFVAESDDE